MGWDGIGGMGLEKWERRNEKVRDGMDVVGKEGWNGKRVMGWIVMGREGWEERDGNRGMGREGWE